MPNLTTPSARISPLNEPEPLDANQLDIDLMWQIAAVYRRFKANWLDGASRALMLERDRLLISRPVFVLRAASTTGGDRHA